MAPTRTSDNRTVAGPSRQIGRSDQPGLHEQSHGGDQKSRHENQPDVSRQFHAEEGDDEHDHASGFERRRGDENSIEAGIGCFGYGSRGESPHHAERHCGGEDTVGRLMAALQPHHAEKDGEDGLPCGEYDRQGQEEQRACLVSRAQRLVRTHKDIVEKSGQRSEHVEPDRQRVGAVVQEHGRNGRDLRRVAVRPVGGRMPAAVKDLGSVDRDLDPTDEARHEHRPVLVARARRPIEQQREHLRRARCGIRLVIGQADGVSGLARAEHSFGQPIMFRRLRKRHAEQEQTRQHDRRLD